MYREVCSSVLVPHAHIVGYALDVRSATPTVECHMKNLQIVAIHGLALFSKKRVKQVRRLETQDVSAATALGGVPRKNDDLAVLVHFLAHIWTQ